MIHSSPSPIELEIAQLRTTIEQYNKAYYIDNAPTISDADYDALMERLITLEFAHPEFADPSSPTQRVGRDRSEAFTQVAHDRPMLSLSNTYNYDEIAEICRRTNTSLATDHVAWVAEMKYDGSSISLIYEEGLLVRAVTRGDGTIGDDVTTNVRTIQSVPLRLTPIENHPDYTQGRIEVRGEVLLPSKEFKRLNRERLSDGVEPFANPRNAAAGTLKTLDSRIVAQRRLLCICYYLNALDDDTRLPDSYYDRMQLLRGMGFATGVDPFRSEELTNIYHYIDEWDVARKELPYATDGIVLKVDSLTQQRALGSTAKSPRWAFAYKYQPENARAQLLSIDYQVGRSGIITPVANVEPVLISGSVVRRATLHNEDFIKSLDLHTHDYVYIEKGGEIIPKITSVETSLRSAGAEPVCLPDVCPACGSPLQHLDGSVGYYCTNSYACPPQIMGRIEHYCTRKAADINVGPETIDDLFELHLLENIDDIYKLTADDLAKLPNFKEKSINNLLTSIEQSKRHPFAQLLYGFGIRYVGEGTARTLAHHFRSIKRLSSATICELQALPDVGPKIAEQVVYYFSLDRNQRLIAELQRCGVILEETAEDLLKTVLSSRLEGERIVISGSFSQHSREEYKQIIEQHGGVNVGSISGRTTFVLAGSDMGPSKRAQAELLGIPLVTEEEFLSHLNS